MFWLAPLLLLKRLTWGTQQMKKIAFVLAALAAIAFAMPVTSADAKEMMMKHKHHHHHHHHMKKMMDKKM
jgi:Ni/Co efflux regulator RcnB